MKQIKLAVTDKGWNYFLHILLSTGQIHIIEITHKDYEELMADGVVWADFEVPMG